MANAEAFEDLRPLVFSIAYRILGTVTEAEDAVQETWLRYDGADVEPDSLKSYLATIVTRTSIDVLRSARMRREAYVGPWFPEPLLTDAQPDQPSIDVLSGDPAHAAELADSVSMAALLLLERLTPLERAVFVMREVFQFGYDDVAAAVGRSEPACRQLAARARRHMDEGRPRFEADRRKREELADRFFDALSAGDLDGLQSLLAADVAAYNDGGGLAGGEGGTFGAERAARILVASVPPLLATGAIMERREVNGHPGAVMRDHRGDIVGTWTLEILDGAIIGIRSITSPTKLKHLGPVGDLRATLRRRRNRRGPR
ncbi:RNA polymerase sigma factor SigJ [Pseudactinotalea sp.]|uniref:RNA polymerase sigma factor SigJ n=1 Tax=Pseudactinotalea sp. TaxID=1926260 RepID=UPI003B3B1DAF